MHQVILCTWIIGLAGIILFVFVFVFLIVFGICTWIIGLAGIIGLAWIIVADRDNRTSGRGAANCRGR